MILRQYKPGPIIGAGHFTITKMKYLKHILFAVCLLIVFETSFVMADIYNASRAVIRVTVTSGIGSGIVVGSDGYCYYAVTNAHVASAGKAHVEFFDAGRVTKAEADVIQRDSSIDLAVLRIDTKGYNPAIIPIDPSYTMKAGDVLATIGHPLGKMPTCYFCTFNGEDEAFGVQFIPGPLEGRSGSPLLSSDGSRVVGIVYAITTKDNVGLAIPAKVVADFLAGAVDGKKRRSSWKPKDSKDIKRLAEKRSILINKEEESVEEELHDENFEEDTILTSEAFTTLEVERGPKRFIKRPGERKRLSREWNRKRLPLRKKPEQQKPIEEPPLEATGISIKVGDVDVGIEEKKEPEKKKVRPALPPRHPAPPPPIHHPYHQHHGHPHQVPPPRRDFFMLDVPKTEGILLTQWLEPLWGSSSCPGGNCPSGNCPGGTCPVPSTQKPADIKATKPIPFEVAGKSPISDLIPDPPPEEKKDDKKEEVASRFALKVPTDERFQKVESRVGAIEKKVEYLSEAQKGIEETGILSRKPIADALENGLGSAGEKLGKAITVEVGDDVHEALTQSVTSMKNVTLSVGNATEIFSDTMCNGLASIDKATTAFTGTMETTQKTLASVEKCTKTVIKVMWVLSCGMIVLAFFTVYNLIYKYSNGNH